MFLFQLEHFYRECIFIVRASFARKPIKILSKKLIIAVFRLILWLEKTQYQSEQTGDV